jgi:FKBP-type peptidyl-prolyl cis-trans isomerase
MNNPETQSTLGKRQGRRKKKKKQKKERTIQRHNQHWAKEKNKKNKKKKKSRMNNPETQSTLIFLRSCLVFNFYCVSRLFILEFVFL